LADTSNQQLPGIQRQYSQPMDLSSVQQIADQAYQAQTSRLDPQWQALRSQEETKLINQGLRPGGEAYDNSMRSFNQGQNDAYQQARLASIQTMPQTYQLASAAYNQPLNTFNALRTGAQVQNPTFGATPGTNYGQAAGQQGLFDQGLYNAQVGETNSMNQGLFGLGAAGLTGAAIFF
jgi:hypothetical protein